MTLRRVLKILVLCAAAGALTGILAGGPDRLRGQEAQASKPGSINNEDCAICHEDLVKAFDRNPHAVLEKSPHYGLKNSCESCHGPGEEHASNGGDKAMIISFKAEARKTYNRQCLACHQKHKDLAAFNGSLHAKSGLACSDCHRVHSPALTTLLLKEPVNTLCLSCHIHQRAEFSRPFHHRVKENALRCTDCHQPHSGLERRQLRTGFTGEAACARCHSEKDGPFVFEHAVLVIRDCQACHQPHGSNNSKMLVRPTVRGLCLECHTASTKVLSSQPPAFHDVRSPRYQNCTTCHVQIHGSNSSRLFLR